MICYKVIHRYRLQEHFERKDIGIYSSILNAQNAIESLKDKNGFRETKEAFRIKRVFRLLRPKLIDKTFWVDGFVTYRY